MGRGMKNWGPQRVGWWVAWARGRCTFFFDHFISLLGGERFQFPNDERERWMGDGIAEVTLGNRPLKILDTLGTAVCFRHVRFSFSFWDFFGL